MPGDNPSRTGGHSRRGDSPSRNRAAHSTRAGSSGMAGRKLVYIRNSGDGKRKGSEFSRRDELKGLEMGEPVNQRAVRGATPFCVHEPYYYAGVLRVQI